ncbi:hypothetical protein DERF_004802 [Dermatophagoides farinae]|uniref:Uncharacterized protein n=1 Tax=Dermatophagoides farinae TaxID=6954 RepID=A0A922I6X1_DERFA|nr:hypothetical protein DERF_004802 [Dermatophagoides farinae]
MISDISITTIISYYHILRFFLGFLKNRGFCHFVITIDTIGYWLPCSNLYFFHFYSSFFSQENIDLHNNSNLLIKRYIAYVDVHQKSAFLYLIKSIFFSLIDLIKLKI